MDPITLGILGIGIGIDAIGGFLGGRAAQRAAEANADSTYKIANLNADLIDDGTEINAGIDDYNADALHGQALDATQRGKETEERFRTQIKGLIESQRASYAGQNVEIGSGSALDVQMDTAYQGELDALTIRTNAAREAWGFDVSAKGARMEAAGTRRLGKLQSQNVRETGRLDATAIRAGGNNARSAANWGVASTILGGAYRISSARDGNREG